MAPKRIDLIDIMLATTNEEDEAVYSLLTDFLEPGDNGITPTGAFADHYKWEPIEKWLTEQMGGGNIGARSIELREAKYALNTKIPLKIDLSRAQRDFSFRLNAIRSGSIRLPYSVEFGMPVIDFINPKSKEQRADLISQEDFEEQTAAPKKKRPRDDESEEEESDDDSDAGRKKHKGKKRKKVSGKKKGKGKSARRSKYSSSDSSSDSSTDSSTDSSSQSDDDDDADNNKSKKKRKKEKKKEKEARKKAKKKEEKEAKKAEREKQKEEARKAEQEKAEEEARKEEEEDERARMFAREREKEEEARRIAREKSEEDARRRAIEEDKEEEARMIAREKAEEEARRIAREKEEEEASREKDLANPGSNADAPILLGDDDDDENERGKAVIKALGKLNKLDTDEYWREVCRFFCRDPETTKNIKVPGLKAPLHGYQAAMVYYVLSRYKTGIAAVGIADEMGLGKTFMVIAIIITFHNLHTHYANVKQLLASAGRPERRRHNRLNDVSSAVCPDQDWVSTTWGIQCPCVHGSMARFIVQNIECLPSLILVPPTLIPNWVAEWEKFVGTDDMKLKVAHSSYENTKYYQGPLDLRGSITKDASDYAEASLVPVNADSGKKGGRKILEPQIRRKGFPGGCGGVVLASNKGIADLQKKFIGTADWSIPDKNGKILNKKNHKCSQLACSFVFFDEVHEVNADSKPMELLDTIAEQNVGPTIAVGLSGSLLTSGPRKWKGLMFHALETADRFGKSFSFGKTTSDNMGAQHNTLVKNWEFLERFLQIGTTDAAKGAEIAQALKSVKDICAGGICGQIIISRSKSDKFHGDDILALEPVTHLNYSLTIPKGSARNGIIKLCRRVRASVDQTYDEANTKWNEGKGPEPNKAEIGYDLLHSQADKSAGAQAMNCLPYFRLNQCAVYPFLTSLYDRVGVDEVFTDVVFQAEHISENFARPYTKELSLRNRTKANLVTVLEKSKSPFWDYRHHLIGHSPKFQTLVKIIKGLIDLKTKPLNEQPDDGPADGSKVRHLVVFTESALSAYLTTILLVESLGDQVEVLLVHSHLPEKPLVSLPNHSRRGFREYFDENCQAGDKNKILIGPYSMLATGHNLQSRASELVLMDVGKENDRAQAINRLHRMGQTLPVKAHQLWDRRNMFEAHRMLHINSLKGVLRKQALDESGYVNWKYFTGEEEPSEVLPPPNPPRAPSPVPANPEAETSEEEESEEEEPKPIPRRVRPKWLPPRRDYDEEDDDGEDHYGDRDDEEEYE
ncbi:Actin-like protein 10 [Pestalotiopsis sp. 9143b]|nr:Actin-like protein 10 [Pestalotiopsis sp. 9143b]